MEQKKKIFYGWWIVAAGFSLMFAGIGIIINTYGVMFGGIIQDTGFSRAGLGLYFTLFSLAIVAGSPLMGRLLITFNIRIVLSICLACSGLTFIALSRTTELWHFYLLAVILGVSISGSSTIPASILLTNWFKSRRGTAIGIAFTGSGIGGMLSNPLAQYLISSYGWRTAYVVLGVMFMAVTLPFSIFVVRLHPSDNGLLPLGETGPHSKESTSTAPKGLLTSEAARMSPFWLLGAALFISDLLIIGVQNNIPIFLHDLGHSAKFAASIMAVYMGVLVPGKMILGGILDRYGARAGISFCLLAFIIACIAFINGRYEALVVLFALMLAMATPVATVYPSFVTGHMFGSINYGPIYGIQNIFLNLGMAVAMPLTGAIFDRTGSMVLTWYLFIGLAIILLMLFYFILSKHSSLKERWHS